MSRLTLSNNAIDGMRLTLGTEPAHIRDNNNNSSSRAWLVDGIPFRAPVCGPHRIRIHALATIAASPNAAHQDILANTALFPMCQNCAAVALADQGDQILAGTDSCMCDWRALMAAVSGGCVHCELDRIRKLKASHLDRCRLGMNPLTGEESNTLRCGCGEAVDGQEEVRKCVGCDRIACKPFHNFTGEELTFRVGSVIVETRRGPSSPGRVERWESLINDLDDVSLPPNSGETNETLYPTPPNDAEHGPHDQPHGVVETIHTRDNELLINREGQGDGGRIATAQQPEIRSATPSPPSNNAENVPAILPTVTPTTPEPIFSHDQAIRLGQLGLAVPPVFMPYNTQFDARSNRLHDLLVANRMGMMTLSAVREMMSICGYTENEIDIILLVGDLAPRIWRSEGARASGAEVLWRLRDRGSVRQACDS